MNSLEIHKSRFFKDKKSVSSFFILIFFIQSVASGTRFLGPAGAVPKIWDAGFRDLIFRDSLLRDCPGEKRNSRVPVSDFKQSVWNSMFIIFRDRKV